MRDRRLPIEGGGLLLAALVGVLVWLPAPAAAHTKLLERTVAPGGVTLTFRDPVPAERTEIDLLAERAGRSVRPGPLRNDPRDPRMVVLPVPVGLAAGKYFASWRTADEDGHVIGGRFDFRIRAGAPAALGTMEEARGSPLGSVARVVQDAALTLAFGLVLFLQVVWRRPLVAAVDDEVTAKLRRVVLVCAVAGAVSAAVAGLTDPGGLQTRAGVVWAAAGGLWLGVALAVRRAPWWVSGALLSLLVVAPALRGHATLAPAVVLHVAAASAWLGGLLALLVADRVAVARLAPAERSRLLSGLATRFGTIALPAAVLVAATGALQAVDVLGTPEDLVITGYGRLLVVKLAAFALLIALAARTRGDLLARLRTSGAVKTAAAVRTMVGAELVLASAALLAAALLAGTAPPS